MKLYQLIIILKQNLYRQLKGGKGYARYITFEHIESQDATRPIVIDQYYCPDKQCKNEVSTCHLLIFY